MDKKGIESFTLAQLSKLIKRNNPTGLDDDFIIIGENLPNTELFKYPCRVDALVAVICLEGELICNINLKEYRITTNMMIINTPENIIQVKDIGNRKFYGIAVSSAFFEQSFLDARDMIPLYKKNLAFIYLTKILIFFVSLSLSCSSFATHKIHPRRLQRS